MSLFDSLQTIVQKNIQFSSDHKALIVYDQDSDLAKVLFAGYTSVLPQANAINFLVVDGEDVKQALLQLEPKDLVVLIQSTSFRFSQFRWRLELFHRGIAVIEHARLAYHTGEQKDIYLDSLSDKAEYFQKVSKSLVPKIEQSKDIFIDCAGTRLHYAGPMESIKKNIGDYSELRYVGGGFPIGEVFTEPQDLNKINGEAMVYAYGNEEHKVDFVDPFRITIKNGQLISAEAPTSFQKILDLLKTETEAGEIQVRELGFGLNNAMSKSRKLYEISAFERVQGIHLSLGRKHAIYRKKLGKDQRSQRFHIDVFLDVQKITIDDSLVYENDHYLI